VTFMTLLVCFLLACFLFWLGDRYPETSITVAGVVGLTAVLFILAITLQKAGAF